MLMGALVSRAIVRFYPLPVMRVWKRVKASDFAHFCRAFLVMTNAPSFNLPP